MRLTAGDELQEVTVRRLFEYRSRRRQLAMWRGLALVAVATTLAMVLAVTLDSLVDHWLARWTASVLIYGVGAFVVYWGCYRAWAESSTLVSEAKRIERRVPELRERLLSAVELAEGDGASAGSQDFRAQLHEQVAASIRRVDVRYLLPLRSITRKLAAGAIALALLLSLCAIPQLHFEQRLLRALLPAANLGRVSTVSIEIERPTPHERLLPQGDIVSVAAVVTGEFSGDVYLELREDELPEAGATRTAMFEASGQQSNARSGKGATRYEQTFVAAADSIQYRVVAAGASTPWYLLTTRERPKAIAFEKRIYLPEYATQEPYTAIEDQGDVTSLVGSRVALAVESNQVLSAAQLHWDAGNAIAEDGKQDLIWNTDTERWTGEFTVTRDATYRVWLKSAETGFINEFSRRYQVQSLDDNAPIVHWTKPTSTAIVATVSDLVTLAAHVSDELPIEKLVQSIRVGEAWIETELVSKIAEPARGVPPTREEFSHTWTFDLLPYKLSAGDTIATKLVAFDQAGNQGESELLTIFISSTSIETGPDAHELDRRELARRVDVFSEKMHELVQALNHSEHAPLRAEIEQQIEAALQLIRSETPSLVEYVKQVAREEQSTVSAMESRLVGELLVQFATMEALKLSTLASLPDADAQQLQQSLKELSANARDLAQHTRSMTSFDAVRRHSAQLDLLGRAMRTLSTPGGESRSTQDSTALSSAHVEPEQLRRQMVVLGRQMKAVQQSMLDSMDALIPESQARMRQSVDQLGNLVDQLERASDNSDATALMKLASNTAASLERGKLLSHLDGNIPEAVKRAHRWLGERVVPPARALENLLRAPASANGERAEYFELQREAANELLAERRSLRRAQTAGSRAYASDLGNARRALDNLLELDVSESEKDKQMRQVTKSLKVLSVAGEVAELSAHLEKLLQGERWNLDTSDAISEYPRIWNAFAIQVDSAFRMGRAAELPQEIAERIDQLRWNDAAKQAERRITSRLWADEPATDAAAPLESLARDLQGIQSALAPFVAEARQQLESFGPSAAELADKAADRTEELSRQTQALTKALERDEVPDPELRIKQLELEKNKSSAPMEDLRESLVDLAEMQNLLASDQLQRARELDAAIDVVDRAQEQTQESIDGLPRSADEAKLALAMQEATEQQSDAADALRSLARALEQADSTNIASEKSMVNSNERRMRDLAETLPAAERTYDRAGQYDAAERLAKLAEANPEEVLRQLELKLKQSEPMQREISEIARTAAEQALERLSQADAQQAALQSDVEASDPNLLAQKQLLLHDLQVTRENAFQMLGLLLGEAKWTAGAAKASKAEAGIASVDTEIRKALENSDGLSEQTPMEDLRRQSQSLRDALQAASAPLQENSDLLQQAAAQAIHQNGADLNNRRREMKDRDRRIQQQDARNAQQALRTQQQRIKQSENAVQRAREAVARSAKQHAQLSDRLAKQPEQAALQSELRRKNQELALARAQVTAQQTNLDELKKREEQAKQLVERVNQRKLMSLEEINPSAELSASLAQLAAQRSAALAAALDAWLSQQPAATQISAAQTTNAQEKEEVIQNEVNEAANHLGRAARHEARLDNAPISEGLAMVAEDVTGVADDQIETVREALARAANEARESSETGQATAESTESIKQASRVAQAAIESSANALRSMLADAGNSRTNQSGTSRDGNQNSPSASRSNSPLDPRQMAQLLDELDRRMNSDLNLGEKDNDSPGQPGQSNEGPSKPTGLPSTLTEAAEQLARQMSRSREPAQSGANADLGMATESQMADVNPQTPVAVRIVDVDRDGASWGQLRSRNADNTTESKRDVIAPKYRAQVEAYFRNLSRKEGQ